VPVCYSHSTGLSLRRKGDVNLSLKAVGSHQQLLPQTQQQFRVWWQWLLQTPWQGMDSKFEDNEMTKPYHHVLHGCYVIPIPFGFRKWMMLLSAYRSWQQQWLSLTPWQVQVQPTAVLQSIMTRQGHYPCHWFWHGMVCYNAVKWKWVIGIKMELSLIVCQQNLFLWLYHLLDAEYRRGQASDTCHRCTRIHIVM